MKRVEAVEGVKFAVTALLVLLVFNVIFVALQKAVIGSPLLDTLVPTAVSSLKTLVVVIIGLAALGFASGVFAQKVFKAKEGGQAIVGLALHASTVFLALGLLTDAIALVATLLAFSTETFVLIALILALVSLLWTLHICIQALVVKSKLKLNQAVISSLLGLVVAFIVLIPVMTIANYVLGFLPV